MNDLTPVLLALLSVGGAAAIDAARRFWQSGRASRRATTKDLIGNLNAAIDDSDVRAKETDARRIREIRALERRVERAEQGTSYWRNRSGEQDYVLRQNNIDFPPATPPTPQEAT